MKKTKKLTLERTTVSTMLNHVRGGADDGGDAGVSAICGSITTTLPTVDVRTHDACGITIVRGRCTGTFNPWPPPRVP